MNQQTNDDVRRAAENLREMVGASVDLDNASVECVRDMWIVAQDHPYLAQKREDTTEGGYVGWTIVAEGNDGSLLIQKSNGARRRIWNGVDDQQREEDDDKPIDGLWLASLGPLKRGDYELQISVDGYCAWWLIDSNGIDRGMYLCHAHTRGQVRRLLEALGIQCGSSSTVARAS